MEIEEGLKYTESHEWIRVEGKEALIGITDYAQESLGDIVFVEMPEIGTELSKGDEALNIESVKVAEAVYAPVTGTVLRVNTELADTPELVNKIPYETFIYSIEFSDESEIGGYMDAAAYRAFVDAQD